MQVRTAPIPPERLSLRNGLPLTARRGEGLAPRHHHQTDPAWHPGPAQRTEHQGSCPGRGLHNLLVSGRGDLDSEGRYLNVIVFFHPLCSQNRLEYDKRVRAQARAMSATE